MYKFRITSKFVQSFPLKLIDIIQLLLLQYFLTTQIHNANSLLFCIINFSKTIHICKHCLHFSQNVSQGKLLILVIILIMADLAFGQKDLNITFETTQPTSSKSANFLFQKVKNAYHLAISILVLSS